MTAPAAPRGTAFVLRSPDPDALACFYRDALDFVDAGAWRGARALVLGGTRLAIERAGPDAAPYPDDVPGWSPQFQHFAIRVAQMDAAMARLARTDGWRAISVGGPQRLPANTGGVTAFKFRDPDGHPLELLAFPDRPSGPLFAGLDHTAISVADVGRSIAFYEGLGLRVTRRSLNRGIAQERLDDVADALVDVVSLELPSGDAPHVELLCYRGVHARDEIVRNRLDDVAATRIVLAPSAREDWLRDPDGHLIEAGSRVSQELEARPLP